MCWRRRGFNAAGNTVRRRQQSRQRSGCACPLAMQRMDRRDSSVSVTYLRCHNSDVLPTNGPRDQIRTRNITQHASYFYKTGQPGECVKSRLNDETSQSNQVLIVPRLKYIAKTLGNNISGYIAHASESHIFFLILSELFEWRD